MTNRILAYVLYGALFIGGAASTTQASDARETPLVRAVKRAMSSVVNIHSEKTTRDHDNLFGAGRGRKVNGMGTGIVVDERGYISTNHHVVDGVDSLRVTLKNGGTYSAKVISTDRTHDLALIKIDSQNPLPVMSMGTSSDLMLGESVFAVGNAFGYEHSITFGIVSALSRDVEVNEKQAYENLIQTDASINPGNSGGPLVNLDGEVVGINVAIRAGAQRIGFAIPIDDARRVIAQLLSVEELNHHYHGTLLKDVKAGVSRKLIVEAAQPNSPAAHAGLRPGDVIVKAGVVDVVDAADFERALLGRQSGESIEVIVKRDDKTESLELTLAELPANMIATRSRRDGGHAQETAEQSPLQQKAWELLGFKLAKVGADSQIFNRSQYDGGMRVVDIRRGSPADVEGIRKGDVLVGLHIWATVSAENVSYVIEREDFPAFGSNRSLKFYILRGRETLYGFMRNTIQVGR